MDGIEIFFVERGGDTTYHSNEQLVCYPLLNLNNIRRDVGWYVRTIEEVIIRTLDDYSIVGSRIANLPGVWINHKRATDEDKLGKKIGSVGVKLSKWCTMHGFSLNVRNVQKGFALIEPCGMPNIKVTSLEEELGYTVEINEVSSKIVHHFLELFNLEGNYSA
jgi:lipoyl(octanoyl) transferase